MIMEGKLLFYVVNIVGFMLRVVCAIESSIIVVVVVDSL
jgi:hypothetical protein